jgi:hypothetical protein
LADAAAAAAEVLDVVQDQCLHLGEHVSKMAYKYWLGISWGPLWSFELQKKRKNSPNFLN